MLASLRQGLKHPRNSLAGFVHLPEVPFVYLSYASNS